MREIAIAAATREDIRPVSRLFAAAFSDSLRHLFGGREPARTALLDIFTFIYEVEPRCFLVAREDDRVVGYCISPLSMRRLWWLAVARGYVLKWSFRWVTGRYGFGFAPAVLLLSNKLSFLTSPHNYRGSDSQILSIAVDATHRNMGIGTALLSEAVTYLRQRRARQLKLEVRPWNRPALRLYEKLGFRTIGTLQDSQGEWLVMVKHLTSPGGSRDARSGRTAGNRRNGVGGRNGRNDDGNDPDGRPRRLFPRR